jgi:LacI family transcriptional regulator
VLINTGADQAGHARFVIDNFGGAQTLTRHLAGAGRKRIAFITGPQGNAEAAERLRGYRAGLKPGMREAVFEGDFSQESGWAAGRRIAHSKPRPDAVFAGNDMMAIGCLAALGEAGLRVPEDVALAGFDDIPIARYVAPALTTIRVPIVALGAAALDALAKAVAAPRGERHAVPVLQVMPVELVVRRSCGTGPPAQPHSGADNDLSQPKPRAH